MAVTVVGLSRSFWLFLQSCTLGKVDEKPKKKTKTGNDEVAAKDAKRTERGKWEGKTYHS